MAELTFTSSSGDRYFTMPDGRRAIKTSDGKEYDAATGQPLWQNKNKTIGVATRGYSYRGGKRYDHQDIAPIDGKTPYTLNGHLVYEPDDTGIVYNYYTRQPFNAGSGQQLSEEAVESMTPAAPSTPSAPSAGPTSSSSRTNGRNVVQKGRDFSAIRPTLQEGIADFNGPSFPTRPGTNKISDPFERDGEKGGGPEASAEESPQAGAESVANFVKSTGSKLQNVQSFLGKTLAKVKSGELGGTSGLTGDSTGPSNSSVQLPETESSKYGEGTAAAGVMSGIQAGIKADTGESAKASTDDLSAWGGTDPASYATSNQEMRRRAAFLNAPTAREGMKAVKAGLGIQEVGQENYANVGGELVRMRAADKTTLLNTDQSKVDAFRKEWAANNLPGTSEESRDQETATSPKTPPTPATAQEPTDIGTEKPESRNVPGRRYGPGGAFQ